ncbi:MAG TPA: hypothetical protein VJT31_33550, partial [Rugosimonospora sp.]|nr:hypothetical protein [Rugosimonospora sp.]
WKDGSRIGSTPAVPQEGRAPMSSKATDDSVRMLAGGFLTLCAGAAVSAVLYFSRGADETVVVTLCAAPPAAFLSLGALVKKIKRLVPDETHHHYNGPVSQEHTEVHMKGNGLIVRNSSQQ